MKYLFLLLFVTMVTLLHSQDKPLSLKKYHFVMLMKGENRSQDAQTAKQLQDGHMANIQKMADDGLLVLAGPFADTLGGGIFVLKTETIEETEKLLQEDPAIRAGRLSYIIRPWYTDSSNFTLEQKTDKKE